MAEVSIKLSSDAQENIIQYIKKKLLNFPRDELIQRYERYERAYHLHTKNPNQGADEAKDSGYYRYQDLDLGLVKTVGEADHAFYTSTLLSETPIFPVTSTNENKDAAQMMNAKLEKDERLQLWETNLSECLKDAAKYNLMAAEVTWAKQSLPHIANGDQGQSETSTVTWQGNKIKHISPYNVAFDTTVPPHLVASEGDWAGYTEYMTQVRLWNHIYSLKQIDPNGVYETDEMWLSSSGNDDAEFGPKFPEHVRNDGTSVNNGKTNWELEFGLVKQSGREKGRQYRNSYVVWTFYLRIIPSIFGMNVPKADMPQIWKFVIVNGKHMAASFRMDDVHQLLNVVLAQAILDSMGLDTDSSSGSIIPMQDVTKQMLDRAFASLDRAIADRALINEEYVDKRAANSRIPDAKIPLRANSATTLSGANLFDLAYKQIPFDSRHINELFNIISTVMEYSHFSAGINRAQLGHFVKGNKTRREFDAIMSNADSKQFVRALVIAMNFFGPIKQIIKTNILQYQDEREEAFSSSANAEVSVDPITLRNASLEFKLVDGLNPRSSSLSGEFYEFFIRMVQEVPQMQQQYKIADIIAHFVQVAGGINIKQYEYTQEELREMAQNPPAQPPAE